MICWEMPQRRPFHSSRPPRGEQFQMQVRRRKLHEVFWLDQERK
jgi:hypothetical protein